MSTFPPFGQIKWPTPVGENLYSDLIDSMGLAGLDQIFATSVAAHIAQDIEAYSTALEQLKHLVGREQQLRKRSCCNGILSGFNVRHHAGGECPCHGRHHDGGELVIKLTSGQISMVETFMLNHREADIIRLEIGHTLYRLNMLRDKYGAASLTRDEVQP